MTISIGKEETAMARAYSRDLRERVMAALDEGQRPEKVALIYRVSARCIYQWMVLRKETGGLSPRSGRRGPKPKLAMHLSRLSELVKERPDATLEELRRALPVKVCIGTLWATLRNLGFSLKKSHLGCGAVEAGRSKAAGLVAG